MARGREGSATSSPPEVALRPVVAAARKTKRKRALGAGGTAASTVVGKCFSKRRQMRWPKPGAQGIVKDVPGPVLVELVRVEGDDDARLVVSAVRILREPAGPAIEDALVDFARDEAAHAQAIGVDRIVPQDVDPDLGRHGAVLGLRRKVTFRSGK